MYFPAFHDCKCELGVGVGEASKEGRSRRKGPEMGLGSGKVWEPRPWQPCVASWLTRAPALSSHLHIFRGSCSGPHLYPSGYFVCYTSTEADLGLALGKVVMWLRCLGMIQESCKENWVWGSSSNLIIYQVTTWSLGFPICEMDVSIFQINSIKSDIGTVKSEIVIPCPETLAY